jgi:signal-transduction protein with cAMP-binding, CBS, and nucleotidyltransferase domain
LNLFTKYTKSETELLLKVSKMEFPRCKDNYKISIFNEISNKEFTEIIKDYKVENVAKKSIIKHNKIIYVLEGSIGLVHNSKIVQKITKNQIYGLSNNLLHTKEHNSVIVLEDSKIASFKINDGNFRDSLTTLYQNLTKHLINELSHYKQI